MSRRTRRPRHNGPVSVFGLPIPWKGVALVAGAAAVFFFLRRRGFGGGPPQLSGFEVFRQGDPSWSSIKIGFSDKTIGSKGCLLTCLTMASNYLRGTRIRPDDANEMGKRVPGSFSGADTSVPVLGTALGLSAPENLRIRNTRDIGALNRRAQAAFAARGVAIFHVDHNNSFSTGDHFVLCFGMNEGQYVCADPATGNYTAIDPNTLKGPGYSGKTYTVLGVAPVFRKNDAPATLP